MPAKPPCRDLRAVAARGQRSQIGDGYLPRPPNCKRRKLMKFNLNPKGKKELVTLVVVFLVVLTISAFAVYFIAGRQSVADNSRQVPQAGAAESTPPDRRS